MATWLLPTTITVEGVQYPICTDFRDIFDVLEILADDNFSVNHRFGMALEVFLEDIDSLPPEHVNEACEQMAYFLNCGSAELGDNSTPIRRMDWEQDALLIVTDINKVAGYDVRGVEYLHWWTFMALFGGIGEGRLSTVVSIREKLRRGKPLDEEERRFYRENRATVDLKTKYTASDEELLNQFLI